MKFQTLSVVAGTKHCNASCPFCVARMTQAAPDTSKPEEINVRNLKKTLHLAKMSNVTTAIITSKGEPLLFPDQTTEYLDFFNKEGCSFPFIELQTNAINIANGKVDEDTLRLWYRLGLTTILISNVGYDGELNRQTYMPKSKEYFNTEEVIKKLHDIGFLVRMTCVGIQGGIDSSEKIKNYVQYCQMIGADQITWRPVNKPNEENSDDREVYEWTKYNGLSDIQSNEVKYWVMNNGTLLRKLVHGAAVFDVNGLNVCLTDCLTHDPDEEEIRQLIFYPNGELYTDWVYKGSRIL